MNSPNNEESQDLERLLLYLRDHRGFDFTNYKRRTLQRRIRTRMDYVDGTSFDNYEAYLDYLEVHPQEFQTLFNTILINVTEFFRDKEAWDYLGDELIPQLLERQPADAPIRMWSAGCASGEEAYSLAILLAEALGMEAYRERVKIYATDVDEDALTQARHGRYPVSALEAMPEAWKAQYFTCNEETCTISESLRRGCIFGRHNLHEDAPISRLDLLVCRNTLIYFNRQAQEEILRDFHFALRPDGYLFLGSAELLLSRTDLFEVEVADHRIFHTIESDRARRRPRDLRRLLDRQRAPETREEEASLPTLGFRTAPLPMIVVDAEGYLTAANDAARSRFRLDPRDVGCLFRDLELSYRLVELRSLIDRTREERDTVRVQDVEYARPQETGGFFDVEVAPLSRRGENGSWLGVLITFDDVTERQHLHEELRKAREEISTVNTELQATNEELETANEELQSTVEELQTTNEELQATNEELQTMNDELHARTVELDRTNAFLESILSSVDVGIVVIDRDFEILLWNQHAEELWGMRSKDVVGRSLLNLHTGIPVDKLKEPVEAFWTASGERNGTVSVEARTRRGEPVRLELVQTIRRGPEGRPQGLVLTMETSSRDTPST